MYSTRDKILLAFEPGPRGDHADRKVISGSSLASHFKMTRASIWKHIKTLQKDGFPIRTRKASGYSLAAPFDFSLLKGEVIRGLRFWKVHYAFQSGSTQDLAKQAATHGSPEGQLWLSEKQTSGRGRLDRRWESGLGGLWFSILLRPAIPPSQVPCLPLVCALTIAETLQRLTPLPIRLKWPNDVMLQTPKGWRKLAGILTEMSAEVDRTQWVVVGIGVNVNNTLPANLGSIGASLHTVTGKLYSRAALLKDFLDRFGQSYRRFEKSGFEAFRSAYWQLYSRPDQPVQLKTTQGVIKGIARGVDARGALLVESQKQTRPIWEGEIRS
jgi:BirA family biotin operon repressor/biotin-[acetyl-CoA-carboxylase] ligase